MKGNKANSAGGRQGGGMETRGRWGDADVDKTEAGRPHSGGRICRPTKWRRRKPATWRQENPSERERGGRRQSGDKGESKEVKRE